MKKSITNWPPPFCKDKAPVYAYNELVMKASPSKVWACLIRASEWENWYSNCKNLRFISSSGPNLQKNTEFQWTTFGVPVTTTVEEFIPNKLLAWSGKGLGAIGYHSWHIEETADGCRVITEEIQQGIIPSIGRVLLRRGLLYYHQKWLEGLEKRALEI